MKRKHFRLWHSVALTIALLVVEAVILWFLRLHSGGSAAWISVLVFAFIGGAANIIVATEVIEEVRNATHMLALLSAVVLQFVAYFAFQYWFLVIISPESFAGLSNDPVSMFLHSAMIFVFNPLYSPTNAVARGLLLINTLEALVLALFILQNVWQFRGQGNAAN